MSAALMELIRMIIVLAFVVGIVVGLGRVTSKWQGKRSTNQSMVRIDVVSRRAVGKNAALLVVRVVGRTFLVSQSSQQLSLLSELDSEQWNHFDGERASSPRRSTSVPRMARVNSVVSPKAWDAFIEHLREMTVRR